jgi:hypothetical protein
MDPGFGALLTPDSKSGIGFYPHPESQTYIFIAFIDKTLGKSTIILSVLAKKFSFAVQK